MGRVPLLLDVDGRQVVCIGAGPVAASKVAPLAAAGAVVTVIAPTVDARLAASAASVHRRAFRPGDLASDEGPVMLAIAATGVRTIDDAVAAEAATRGIWCLRIDGRGDVAVPSVLRRDGLTVAVSTGAPALTRRLRILLDDVIDERWGIAATSLAALRADPSIRAAMGALDLPQRRARWRAAVQAALADRPAPVEHLRAILSGTGDD